MSASRAFRILCCLPLVALLGCGSGGGPVGPTAPAVTIRIQPDPVLLPGEETQTFQALVTGGADLGVTWSVAEGPLGGAITAEGVYTAPSEPGEFHVTATSRSHPGTRAVASVKVLGKISVAISPTTSTLASGGSQTFTATVQNATDPRVTWSATGGTITPNGLYTAPETAGTYVVRATSVQNARKSATATVTVAAPPQPLAIASFTASPDTITAGQSSQLQWDVTGATSLSVAPGIGPVTGTALSVSPATTTAYTLTASNAAGAIQMRSLTVTVLPAPTISAFQASPATIGSGESSQLTGVFSQGTGVITPGNLDVTSGLPVTVTPSATTTYTLTVTNAAGAAVSATATVQLTQASGRPRILLNHAATLAELKAAVVGNTAPALRFRAMVDRELAAPGTIYAFEARHAALMYQLTGVTAYGTFAVSLTEAFVTSEETLINANQRATIAGDSYLEVGPRLGNVAQVYDWCFDLLTPSQRSRWITYMNRVLFNVWNPERAVWGTGSFPWSGWSINNPANNYYYSFLEATMLTGLATYPENPQAQAWRDHFAHTKIASQLIPMFNADLIGGGSREGTGYGTAMKNLFKLYFLWEKSTGQAIANLTDHTRLTATWMAHATVPTLDKLAPIGDHARDSTAALFDYHREMLLSLIAQYPEDPGARATKQLLADSSVPRMEHAFNFWADLLYDRPAVAPLPLSTLNTAYYGPGTGNLFTRSSWAPTATLAHFIAGPYSESHAHRDQGSFLLYRGDWLLDDQNLRSHSGIEMDEEMHNLVRFVSAGQTVTMVESGPETEMLALADHPQFTYALANTLPAYNAKAQVVKSEREFLFLKPGTLVVFDRAAASDPSVARVFALNMALAPTIAGDHLALVRGANQVDVHRIAPLGVPWTTTAYGAGFPGGGVRADASHAVGSESLFLHVLSTNGDVTSVTANPGAGTTGTTLTFADGRTATIRFSNAGRGGTLNFRSATGAVLFDGALPTTVTVPALLSVP